MKSDEPSIEERLERVLRKNWANAHVPSAPTPLEVLIAGEEQEDRDEDEEMRELRQAVRWETFEAVLQFVFQHGPDPLQVLRMTFAIAKVVRPELLGQMSLDDIAIICADGGKATVSARIQRIYPGTASFQKRGNYSEPQRGNQNRKKKKGRSAK